MSEPFDHFLHELRKILPGKALIPDPWGIYFVLIRKELSLLFEFDDHLTPTTVLLSSPIAFIPATHRRVIYELSLMGNATLEETLSVKPDEEILYLHRRLHPQLEGQALKSLLDSFVATCERWQERIKTTIQNSLPPPSPHSASLPIFPYKF